MDSIYKLQQRAASLRAKTQTGSITPDEVGGLQYDTLAYLAGLEQDMDGLGIRKVYTSVTDMEADIAPTGTNGRALRIGQLVMVYDPSESTAEGTGCIYAYQKPGWVKVGNIGDIHEIAARIDAEAAARKSADDDLILKIQDIQHVRSVGIGELDSYFTGTMDALKGVVDGVSCGVWMVRSNTGYCSGVLEVWMDSSMHCITQRLVSNFTVNESGVIDGYLHQHTVHEYYRLYNFSWSNGKLPDGTDWPVGSWSAWTEVQGGGVADLGEYLTRSEANGMYATGEALWQHQVEAESRMGNLEASADYLTRRVTALGTVYQAKGTVASVDALLELGKAAAGDVYNVVAGGTLGGKKYSAGTNFVCTTAFTSASDNKAGCWDALGGTFDLSGYVEKTDAAIMREADADGFLAHGVYPGAVTRHKTTATGSESSHMTWQVVECTPVTNSSGGTTTYEWLRIGINTPTGSSNYTVRLVVQYCSKTDTAYPADSDWQDLNVHNQLDLQAAITKLGSVEKNVSGALERVAALEEVVDVLEGRIAALEQSMTLILTNGVSESNV